jgi:hypothetical protein
MSDSEFEDVPEGELYDDEVMAMLGFVGRPLVELLDLKKISHKPYDGGHVVVSMQNAEGCKIELRLAVVDIGYNLDPSQYDPTIMEHIMRLYGFVAECLPHLTSGVRMTFDEHTRTMFVDYNDQKRLGIVVS